MVLVEGVGFEVMTFVEFMPPLRRRSCCLVVQDKWDLGPTCHRDREDARDFFLGPVLRLLVPRAPLVAEDKG